MGKKQKILLVEDESHLAVGLKLNFEFEGYAVDIAETARKAKELLCDNHGYEMIILDISLPDEDGFEVCKTLRMKSDFTPVLMLTARALASDRVYGLEARADDYLTKPFDLDELLARVRSILRRQKWSNPEQDVKESHTFGKAMVDFEKHEAKMGTNTVKITALEMSLLHYFISNEGRVLSRKELLTQVWKLPNYPNTRTVDNFVMRLRRQFETDPTKPIHFLSIRGAGYKFQSEAS